MHSSDSLRTHLPKVEGKTPQRTYSVNDLMAIDPSALQSLVHFCRPNLLRTVHETYAKDEYDRTSIQVRRRSNLALTLPERGDRSYQRDDAEDSSDELNFPIEVFTERLSQITLVDTDTQEIDIPSGGIMYYFGGPSSPPPPMRPTTPIAAFMDAHDGEDDDDDDEEESDRALAFFMRRPGTPLPALCLRTAADSDDEDASDSDVPVRSPASDVSSSLADISDSDGSDGSVSSSDGRSTPK